MPNKQSSPFLLTIITVVYNDYQNLKKTLQSLDQQTDKGFEYIIIDGGSTDGSLELAHNYSHLVDLTVSEKDKGIYDAMNKGIRRAAGEFINFLNAGDTYYSSNTVAKVKAKLKNASAHILYGKVMKLSSEKSQFFYEQGNPISEKDLFLNMPICHQSMFTARELFKEHKIGLYDTNFKSGADYEWLGTYYSNTRSLEKLVFFDEPICIYLDGGFSFKAKKRTQIERLKTASRHFSPRYILLNYLNFIVEYSKAILLPLMVKMNLLDAYRRLKYSSKSSLAGSK